MDDLLFGLSEMFGIRSATAMAIPINNICCVMFYRQYVSQVNIPLFVVLSILQILIIAGGSIYVNQSSKQRRPIKFILGLSVCILSVMLAIDLRGNDLIMQLIQAVTCLVFVWKICHKIKLSSESDQS